MSQLDKFLNYLEISISESKNDLAECPDIMKSYFKGRVDISEHLQSIAQIYLEREIKESNEFKNN